MGPSTWGIWSKKSGEIWWSRTRFDPNDLPIEAERTPPVVPIDPGRALACTGGAVAARVRDRIVAALVKPPVRHRFREPLLQRPNVLAKEAVGE